MRLTERQEKEATEELLSMLEQCPAGLSTSDMRGTDRFHGVRTLSNRQISRLLRRTNRTAEQVGGFGIRTYTIWRLRARA